MGFLYQDRMEVEPEVWPPTSWQACCEHARLPLSMLWLIEFLHKLSRTCLLLLLWWTRWLCIRWELLLSFHQLISSMLETLQCLWLLHQGILDFSTLDGKFEFCPLGRKLMTLVLLTKSLVSCELYCFLNILLKLLHSNDQSPDVSIQLANFSSIHWLQDAQNIWQLISHISCYNILST